MDAGELQRATRRVKKLSLSGTKLKRLLEGQTRRKSAPLTRKHSHRLPASFRPEKTRKVLLRVENLGASSPRLLKVPLEALPYVQAIVEHLAMGREVTVLAKQRELTTQQAADLLSVSRPYLIQRMEAGDLPYRKVGTHRRVLVADVLRYQAKLDEEAERALGDLVALDRELGLT